MVGTAVAFDFFLLHIHVHIIEICIKTNYLRSKMKKKKTKKKTEDQYFFLNFDIFFLSLKYVHTFKIKISVCSKNILSVGTQTKWAASWKNSGQPRHQSLHCPHKGS